jgi:MinD superfamily P-loop ATPase
MNIAIASGKGGTGKTTVATNLSLLLAEKEEKVSYLDCDVEEPNGHLFLNPRITHPESAAIPVPVIDESKCDGCGECVRFCQYRALVRLGKTVMVFPELCHGCGGCMLVCPRKAIAEKERTIGTVEGGVSGNIAFVHGRLNIGEAMSPPLIRRVLGKAAPDGINIIDAPPGTSCPVIASVRNAGFVVLVTEPTPFGLNDLGLALDMIDELNIPHGAVINRAEANNHDAQEFCRKRQVLVLAQIPDDRRIAEAYSRGEMVLTAVSGIRDAFLKMWQSIRKQMQP